jgi:hypothetical protein
LEEGEVRRVEVDSTVEGSGWRKRRRGKRSGRRERLRASV